jgi:nicotinamidase-related amidase
MPSILRLRQAFDTAGWPVIYLRLCGFAHDRSDLHRFFRKFQTEAESAGFDNCYPLAVDPWSAMAPSIQPRPADLILEKTGFSGFGNPDLPSFLAKAEIGTLVMTGLATSQCVDTTARDGSDRGFSIVHVHDAQADYSEDVHHAALFASCGVCGANISNATVVAENLVEYVRETRGKEL